MFLLIRVKKLWLVIIRLALHSNMFLLIRVLTPRKHKKTETFTFQYVSINTSFKCQKLRYLHTLHSNMFLLIPDVRDIAAVVPSFTFQYVSINTTESLNSSRVVVPLHSNMFLLIRNSADA